MANTDRIMLRISPELKADFEHQAKSAGVSLSAWIIRRCHDVRTKPLVQAEVVRTIEKAVRTSKVDEVAKPDETYRRFAKPGSLLKGA